MLLLNVPYAEKDEAKSLGAKWNPRLKKWYIENKENYPLFKKWLPHDYIVCDHIYVIEGSQQCFRCGKNTRVIGFGIENYYRLSDSDCEYSSGEIHFAFSLNPIPEQLLNFVQDNYNFKETYSKTTKSSYLANRCDSCDTLQGDFYLFEEVGSPFCCADKNDISRLRLYRINLDMDININLSLVISSTDFMLKKYGHIYELKFEI